MIQAVDSISESVAENLGAIRKMQSNTNDLRDKIDENHVQSRLRNMSMDKVSKF